MLADRRTLLRRAIATTAGLTGLQALASRPALAQRLGASASRGYGPLVPDPAGVLDLPHGFSYRIISRVGDAMDDGFLVPGRPDGMAAFRGPEGLTIVVRNHEMNPTDLDLSPFGPGQWKLPMVPDSMMYDRGRGELPAMGGTTTVVFDTSTQRVRTQHLSLAGTLRNCAGGPTPWNSWITCEEDVTPAGDVCARDHGFNFEVPARTLTEQLGLVEPIPLRAMGRFNHEAVAVNPITSAVYQSEDRPDAALYRFIPGTPGKLADGGRLQALAVVDAPTLDTRNWDPAAAIRPGHEPLRCRWLDIENVESPKDDLRYQAADKGCAVFARTEGMWLGRDGVYFACTSGGANKCGQIWRLVPARSDVEGTEREAESPATLQLFIEPNDSTIIENADNLTVAPWGDLFVCEDGTGDQFLLHVTAKGDVTRFARNAISDSELAGACFSPDGSTMFLNIQHTGLTLAITGPWARRA